MIVIHKRVARILHEDNLLPAQLEPSLALHGGVRAVQI